MSESSSLSLTAYSSYLSNTTFILYTHLPQRTTVSNRMSTLMSTHSWPASQHAENTFTFHIVISIAAMFAKSHTVPHGCTADLEVHIYKQEKADYAI
jgi:hypothetical protein